MSGKTNTTKDTSIKRRQHNGIQNGWFTETATMWPGQRFSLALKNYSEESILFHQQSKYQDILVFQSAQYGKVFVIDGILQLTERDEFAFHEMMVHLPMFAHSQPKQVLIIGGGDGLCLREVCRHVDCVEHITLVEIDPMVIKASKEYLKLVPEKLYECTNPKVEIVIADAAEYLRDANNRNKFDVILADTLDPMGPAESLYEPEFYETLYETLKPDGILCVQGESFFIHLDLIKDLVSVCRDMFDMNTEYATTMAPSYPCGQIGFILARKKNGRGGGGPTPPTNHPSCRNPVRPCPFQRDLKWYSPQMHRSAFILPYYIQKELLIGLETNGSVGDDAVHSNGDEDAIEEEKCFLSECSIS